MPHPQNSDPDYADYVYSDEGYYDDEDFEVEQNGPPIQEAPVFTSDDEDEAEVEEPFDQFAEEVLNDFKMKDGGPIPLLEMIQYFFSKLIKRFFYFCFIFIV